MARRARRAALAAGAGAAAGLATAGPAPAATFTVQNTNPDGPGSLFEAVEAADEAPDPDTIRFAPAVTGTINLITSLTPKYATTIEGPGADALTIVSGAGNPAITQGSGYTGDLVVEGVTLVGNQNHAVESFGRATSVTIRDSVVTGESAWTGANGGAIDVGDIVSLTLDGVTVTGSETSGAGGGLRARDVAVKIDDSTFSDNSSETGGGAIYTGEGSESRPTSLLMRNSRVVDNDSLGAGGGISADTMHGDVSILRSTVSGNFTPGRGAGIYLGYAAKFTLDSSTVSQNGSTGTIGGGIFAYAPDDTFTVRNSTIANNPAKRGGGLYWFNYYDVDGIVANSTITGNSASGLGGGIYRFGYDGSGPAYEGPDSLTLSSSVVAGNTSPHANGKDLVDGYTASGPGGFVVDHSLIGESSSATVIQPRPATNRLNVADPRLGPLANNGGPTRTMLPLPDSPLLDAGAANGLLTDQRGRDRTADQPVRNAPGSAGADIGAAERDDTEILGVEVRAKSRQPQKGRKVEIEVIASALEEGAKTAVAEGSVKVGRKRVPLRKASGTIPAGQLLKLTLSPRGKAVAKALKRGDRVKASIAVTVSDEAGNAETVPVKVKLTAPRKQGGKGKGGGKGK